MEPVSREVLARWQTRKTKRQKRAFEEFLLSALRDAGYADARAEECGALLKSRNLIAGDPGKAKVIFTAHYDTCAVLPVPNYITPMNLPVWIFYQLLLVLGIFLAATALGALVWLLPLSEDALFLASKLVFTGSMLFMGIWMIAGKASAHTANDNTSGVVTLLEIARSLPESQRGKVCFVLFDLEEAGLIGSAAYRKAHKKASDSQLVLNLDCVGDGDHIRFFPTKKLEKDRKKLTSLYKACGYFGKKDVLVHEKGFSVYPSDQANFPYGVGICALRKKGKTLYLSRIHTPKDTILEETNVNILRAALITFITCGAAQ